MSNQPHPPEVDLFIYIKVDDFFANRDELAFRNEIADELERRGIGDWTGSGSGCGEMDISYIVTDEQLHGSCSLTPSLRLHQDARIE